MWTGAGAGQVQRGSGDSSEGSREGSGEGPGEGSGEALVQSQVRPNRVPEEVPEKVPEALVQSQVKFNMIPENSGGLGGFGARPGQVRPFFGTFSETLLNLTWLCTKASQAFSGTH